MLKIEQLVVALITLSILNACTPNPASIQHTDKSSITTEPTEKLPSRLLLGHNEIPGIVVPSSPYLVSRILDGDTFIVVNRESEQATIKIGCIDAPERLQIWGPEAWKRLQALLPIGQPVELNFMQRNSESRYSAEVLSKGKAVGLQLIQEGYAVVDQQDLNSCQATSDEYLIAESKARSQQLQFWSQVNPIMPWDFRHKRSAWNRNS